MSEENVDLIRRWWAETTDWFNDPERDPRRMLEIAGRYASKEVVYEEDPVWPDAGTYRGINEIVERFLEYMDVLQIQHIEAGKVRDAGDQVYFEVEVQMGLGADAGQSQTFLWGYTAKVEKGRVQYFRAWFDPEEARRAVGLSPDRQRPPVQR